ncbi:hypothetical protein SAMN02799630_01708 [Paenibacillus sp. UNCCL117]|nr:hypothetical protein SAMN04488602_104194 [Paenibacillus sp. cl123]SFW29097.1 hypothetical protein SAMN02799630_01708 [Paenibacillus sp. UNCCL117]
MDGTPASPRHRLDYDCRIMRQLSRGPLRLGAELLDLPGGDDCVAGRHLSIARAGGCRAEREGGGYPAEGVCDGILPFFSPPSGCLPRLVNRDGYRCGDYLHRRILANLSRAAGHSGLLFRPVLGGAVPPGAARKHAGLSAQGALQQPSCAVGGACGVYGRICRSGAVSRLPGSAGPWGRSVCLRGSSRR